MNTLKAGFARVNITPMRGIGLAGYFKPRFAEGVLDELEINALALACGEEKTVLVAVDHCGIAREIIKEFKEFVIERTGLKSEEIYIHATHTHTAPYLNKGSEKPLEQEYYRMVQRKLVDAIEAALEDLKPARMGFGVGQAPNIAFVRRFRMKDGSIRTNPGVNNPEIAEPIGAVDERVSVLRFDREGAEDLVLIQFANHPDVVGGSMISADWPGFARRQVEKTIDGTRCICFNGTQGDVNHVNVHPTGGFLNDTFMDFDDVSRGYGHARFMGRVIAGGVLQVYDKVEYVDVDSIKCGEAVVHVPSNKPLPEEMPEAKRINDLHVAGRDDELPYKGMMLTTMVADAARKVRMEHGPEFFEMEVIAVAIGKVVMIGLPGEPFTGVGRGLKDDPDWKLVLPTCNTNGKQGYFPMKEAYDEGGYEAGTSNFKAGVAELMIAEGKKLIEGLR